MTKEDRLNDIQDYVYYLDQVYREVFSNRDPQKARIHILGFSQGVATVSRWMRQGQVKANSLILWSGLFPPDMDFEIDREKLSGMAIKLICGTKDEFIDPAQLQEQAKKIEQAGLPYDMKFFEGNHDIQANALLQLAGEL